MTVPSTGAVLLRELLAARFWVVPAACCLVALLLGLLLPELDERVADDVPLLFSGGPDGARSLLSAVTTSMISVTALVFSITIVVLQLASSQFSPRVLRTFLRSATTQLTLGVFLATFLYAIAVLRAVRDVEAPEGAFVPQVAVTVAFLLVLASVAVFVGYVSHITRSIRVTTIVDSVGSETRALVDRVRREREQAAESPLPPGGPVSRLVRSPAPGVLVRVDVERLTRLAREHDVQLDVLVPVGGFAAEGMPLVAVHRTGEGLQDADVVAALSLGRERSMEQDVAFGFRQLVDVAERALSPAVNDPTTAVEALDQMHDLLRRLAAEPDPPAARTDVAGGARVVLVEHRFADLLSLAFVEVISYANGNERVLRHIRRILDDVADAARAEHLPALAAMRRRLAAAMATLQTSGR